MPQMAPINWLMIFVFMISFMMIISSMNYFLWINNSTNTNNYIKYKLINWKW